MDFGGWGDPAPLARPYLVPTRDWGVVVDTASVPEINLADSRTLRVKLAALLGEAPGAIKAGWQAMIDAALEGKLATVAAAIVGMQR